MYELRIYKTVSGKEPYLEWYLSLDNSQKIIVAKRLQRIKTGNLGDYKDLGNELKELKFSNGTRIYFAQRENIIILLLNGGNKKRQSKDIAKANEYLAQYNERNKS